MRSERSLFGEHRNLTALLFDKTRAKSVDDLGTDQCNILEKKATVAIFPTQIARIYSISINKCGI